MTEETNKKLEEHYCKEFLKKEWFDKPGKRTLSEHMFFTAEYFAQWSINNIWHHTKEEPQQQSRIIIDYGSEPSIAGCYHGSTYKIDNKLYWYIYDGFVVKEVMPSKWCCFDDIFPYNK